MAAPDLRVVRRPKSSAGRALTASVPAPNALVAASSPVRNVADIFKSTLGRRDSWQDEAWQLYDEVGELGCYVRWRARSCSRVKLIPSEIDAETGQPTGGLTTDKDGKLSAEGEKVAAIVRSIASGPLGQAELIERAVTLLSVPGELYIAILVTAEGERWEALSLQQIKRSQRNSESITIKLPEGGEHEFTPRNPDGTGRDGMFRVWNAHAKIPTEADSPVRSNLSPLREIARTTVKIENADRSRLGNNGLLIIPAEASLPDAQAPVSAGKPGDPPADTSLQQTAQSLQAKIVAANDLGLQDPKSHAAITPIVAKVPAEHADKVKHITFGKDSTEFEIKKREAATVRFARGIDMEPDQLLGLGDTNHWNGVLLADQDVNLHVKPPMKTLCNAFYRNVIRPMFVKAEIDPDRYVLTIDASEITADPDKSDEAKDANERGALTNAALLRHMGLPEDDGYTHDLAGLQQRAWDQVMQADPSQFVEAIRAVAPLLDQSIQKINFPAPVAKLPAGRNGFPDDEDDTDEVDGSPPDTEGKAPRKPAMVASVAAGDGVSIAADSYLTRALELAGKRRVKTYDHDQRARLASRPAYEWHQSLPAVAEAEVGRLIAGYDSGLDDLAAKYGFSADEVRADVTAEARRRLTSQVVDG